MINEKTMLIADDNSINRALLSEIFKNDFIIYEAENGQEALDIMRKYHGNITILVLDLIMPIKNGFDVMKEMKEDSEIADIPIIVVTAVTDAENEIKVLDCGASDIVTKPFDARVIVYRVNNIVQKNELVEVKLENAILRTQNQAQIQLKAIMDNMIGGVALVEIKEIPNVLYLNNGFYKMSHYTKEGLKESNINVALRFHPDDCQELFGTVRKAINTSEAFLHVCRAYNAEDEIIWVQLQGVRIIYEDSKYPVILVIVNDITEQKNISDELNEKTVHLSTLINNMPGGVSILEYQKSSIKVTYVNDTLAQLCGYNCNEYLNMFGDDFTKAINHNDIKDLLHNLREGALNNSSVQTVIRQLCKDDTWKWLKIISTPIYIEKDVVTMYTLCLDYSSEHFKEEEIKKATNELIRRANYDDLTGLYNREAFCEYTNKVFHDYPNEEFFILVINIRGFKLMNDILGEAYGNEVLKKISEMLISGKLKATSYGRLQADHFAVCIKKSEFNRQEFAQIMYKELSPFSIAYDIKLAIGIYDVHDIDIAVTIMCDRANLALQYSQITDEDETYFIYNDDIRSHLVDEQIVLSQFDQALEEKQFAIYLQPVYNLTQEEIVSAEVLVRWIHPYRGLISPGYFIPVLEKHGYISRLDRYVWEEACRYLNDRKLNNLPVIPISVNASRASITSIDIVKIMLELTRKYDISPDLLRIEITESLYTDNPQLLASRLKELKQAGFIVLMDDFGSGYSSFNALKDLDVSILKIDMNFLLGVEDNPRASTILASVVRMAKWIGMPIIAEGVEKQSQAEFLKSIGCYLIQGYYFSKPIPPVEFNNLPHFKYLNTIDTSSVEYKFDTVNEIFTANPTLVKLFNGVNCAAGIFEYHNGKLEVMRVNDTYYNITGYNADTIYEYANNAHNTVYKDDLNISEAACKEVLKTHGAVRAIIRRKHRNGTLIWINIQYTYFGTSRNKDLLFISFYDISSEMEEASLLSVTTNMDDIMPNLPVGIIIYEIINNQFYNRFSTKRAKDIIGLDDEIYASEYLDKPSKVVKLNKEDHINTLIKEKKNIEVVMPVVKKDGQEIWVRMVKTFIKNDDKILCYMTLLDVTEIILEQHQKAKQDEIYKMLLDSSQVLVFDYDFNTDKLDYSIYIPDKGRKYITIPDYSKYILTSNTIYEADKTHYCRTFFRGIRKNTKGFIEYRANYYNNEFCWYRCHYRSIEDENGRIYRTIGRAYAIQGEVKAREKLLSRLSIDDLSGLLNHSTTKKLIDKRLKYIDDNNRHAFFMIDIDDFKGINDTYGHPVGDIVIKEIAKTLNIVFRKEDIISRLSGDEFSALCDIDNIPSAEERAKKLLNVVNQITIPSKPNLRISISIGIAFAPQHGKSFSKIFAAADSALYDTKHKGKNNYTFFSK